MKSTSTSATKSACASKVRFDEWHTTSWDSALKRIRRLGGLHSFKSVLFKQAFEQPHYQCEFMILSLKGKLQGAMTYWFEKWNETYKVGPIWHIGDFDTAKGTSGMGHTMLSRFMDLYGKTFYLWCWDDEAEKFWRHMARRYKLSVHKIGVTKWGSAVLLFSPAPRGKLLPLRLADDPPVDDRPLLDLKSSGQLKQETSLAPVVHETHRSLAGG